MKATDRADNFGTYFVTVNCASKRRLFHMERNAALMFEVLQQYREHYKLHSFVIMPDHLHVLLTPSSTLERSMQLIKGGFSFRYHKEFGGLRDVWQKRYTDHRCRDISDFETHKRYIEMNPVVAGLCEKAEEYAWSSVSSRLCGGDSLRG
ncbi:transposase [Terriglobus sp. RCC_193]|uniref:REP-associated tyrosine transposase n=1 Tax=Terriglobus sp. RCC_193 TaxID=3239218 RepID=UPI0035266466